MLGKAMIALAFTACGTSALAQMSAGEQGSAATRLQAAKTDKETLRFNLESAGKLIETSSAARQIESSKVPEALAKREKAREFYKSAQTALSGGDLERASLLLADARATFFDAVRLAAPGEVTAAKLVNDYKARLDSVNALLTAYKRIASEKGRTATGLGETVAPVEKGIAEAGKLAQEGKYKEARSVLDGVYLVTKAGVSGLRSGDTLVRSLNFASKEEEYRYEIDRNDTHQLLIDVLLSEKRGDSMVQRFIAKARELRTQAEGASKGKDYATGVKLLEESTAELVRAIRGAGIYIPG